MPVRNGKERWVDIWSIFLIYYVLLRSSLIDDSLRGRGTQETGKFWRLSKTNNTIIGNYVGIWHRFEIILTVNELISFLSKAPVEEWSRKAFSFQSDHAYCSELVRMNEQGKSPRWEFTVIKYFVCNSLTLNAFRWSLVSKRESSNKNISVLFTDLQRFRNECVAAHNFYRAAHGTPPICWSTKLAESAQSWAEQLARTTGSLRYSSEKGVGENLACLWGSELNGQKVTRIWYEEGQHFDYNKPRVSSRTRSFCQVVWEGTRELGAGAAVTEHGKQIVVARYYPPVNKKDVAKNVKKSRSTEDGEKPLAYDTRWSRLYVGKEIAISFGLSMATAVFSIPYLHNVHRFTCMKLLSIFEKTQFLLHSSNTSFSSYFSFYSIILLFL